MALTPLDHKVPPPVVFLVAAGAAWLLRWLFPALTFTFPGRSVLTILCVLAGIGLGFWGMLAFRRAGTTIDPHAPERTCAFVGTGPYRVSRNPMYLGLAWVLLAVCIHLGNAATLFALAGFIAYLTRFQIRPEERVLLAKFGEPYARYLRTVRRWL